MIEDIDFEALQRPMRASTPAPSINDTSTIVAGHLDFSIGDLESTVCKQEEKDEMIEDLHIDTKAAYCADWMDNQEGISTTNSDPPPSLYASSVSLNDSLLDETSISRNKPLPSKVPNHKKLDRDIILMLTLTQISCEFCSNCASGFFRPHL